MRTLGWPNRRRAPRPDKPADVAEGCRQRGETVHVVGHRRQVTTGEEPADTSPYQDVSIAWDRGTGLVLEWSKAVRGGSSSGRLVATDAFGR